MPEVVTAPRRERPDPYLAEQVVGGLVSRPAGQEPVYGDLVTLDDLDERIRAAARGPLDQRAVRLHVTPRCCLSTLLLPASRASVRRRREFRSP
jgi:hypothetical protein